MSKVDSTSGVHCWPGPPLYVQTLTQCLSQSRCPISKFLHAQAYIQSPAQLQVLHICTLSCTDEYICTHSYMYLIIHVHLYTDTHSGTDNLDHTWCCRPVLSTEHWLHPGHRPLSFQGSNPLGGKTLPKHPETPWKKELLWRVSSQQTDDTKMCGLCCPLAGKQMLATSLTLA